MRIKPPKIIRKLFPTFIWNFPNEKDGIFLTFDDGPRPEVTPWVLDILDKYNLNSSANVNRLKEALTKKEIITFNEYKEAVFIDPLLKLWFANYFFVK